jgi:rhodanese-related sulfurtransferase
MDLADVLQISAHVQAEPTSAKPLILVDVREPHELKQTGRIPGARNLPVSTLPGHLFLPADEFEDALGWQKPQSGDEVVFYCKSGVRSRSVAAMVREEWGKNGVKVAEFPGSWTEWAQKGGKAEKME